MSSIAIMLVCGSALMHVAWNLICKSCQPSAAFFLISTGASILVMSPLTLYFLPIIPYLPPAVMLLLVLTGMVQAIYYVSLGNAYRLSEISMAYPLTRALPVLLVPAVTIVMGLGTRLGAGTLMGMGMVCIGCLVLPLMSFSCFRASVFLQKGLPFIIGAAVSTVAYTIIDSEALKIFRITGMVGYLSTALIYVAWENIIIEMFLVGYVILRHRERLVFRKFCTMMGWRLPALSGVISTSSYTLVLLAMIFVDNVSYVVAFRQLSIPLGAILGIILFKEQYSRPKIAGIILISTGLLIIGLLK